MKNSNSSMPSVENGNDVSIGLASLSISLMFSGELLKVGIQLVYVFIIGGRDLIDYVVLSKPPPTCICNHSGEEPLLYSLGACEPNGKPAGSNVC